MDTDQAIQDINKHIDVLNREMGVVMADVAWIKWWVRAQMVAIGATFITTLVNLALSLK